MPWIVILSEAKDLVLIDYSHAPCHASLTSRQSGLIDSIKATFFARNQPLRRFSCAQLMNTKLTSLLVITRYFVVINQQSNWYQFLALPHIKRLV